MPSVCEVKDRFDLEGEEEEEECIEAVMGAGVRNGSKGSESARTHEFILWCHISLLRSISH